MSAVPFNSKSWFAKLGSILLLFACFGLVGGGMIRIPRGSDQLVLGWIMLVGGFLLAFATIDQWGSVLPGVFGVAGLNALNAVWSGHLTNQPMVLIPRSTALILTLVFFAAAVLSGQVAIRKFSAVHRILFFAVFVLVPVSMLDNRFAIPGSLSMLACLVVLWGLPKPPQGKKVTGKG